MNFKISLLVLLVLSLVSCKSELADTSFTKEDESIIRNMINSYQEGWLENDSSKIIKLFSDSAILIPSGLMPINGKEEIIKFWWPNDGSITKINDYKIILIEIAGTSDMAYTYENGKLSWSYQKENFSISKTQESFELTVFRKSEGRWRIMKRIWTDIKR